MEKIDRGSRPGRALGNNPNFEGGRDLQAEIAHHAPVFSIGRIMQPEQVPHANHLQPEARGTDICSICIVRNTAGNDADRGGGPKIGLLETKFGPIVRVVARHQDPRVIGAGKVRADMRLGNKITGYAQPKERRIIFCKRSVRVPK